MSRTQLVNDSYIDTQHSAVGIFKPEKLYPDTLQPHHRRTLLSEYLSQKSYIHADTLPPHQKHANPFRTMSTTSQKLSDVPAAFARYTFAQCDTAPTGEMCFVCRRPFGETTGPEEPPCHPLVLASCGHLIGSECSQAFIKSSNTKRCPLCQCPVYGDAGAMPRWLVWISMTPWFYHRDRKTSQFAMERKIFPKRYIEHLYERLFARDLRYREAFDLWYCHAKAGLYGFSHNAKVAHVVLAILWLFTLPWGKHYPELWLIPPPFVDTRSKWWCVGWLACVWITVTIVAKWHLADQQDVQRKRVLAGQYYKGLLVLYGRLIAVILGYKGLLAVTAASWLAYCAFGALLIAYCVKARQ